jgi:hypothetical protein
MLNLPQITLCCIDTRYPQLALYAIKQSVRGVNFGDVVFITTHNSNDTNDAIPSIRVIEIKPIKSVEEYSSFVLTSLKAHIHTPYVLLIQWDGYVINPQAWSNDFFNYDYIGAPWLQKDGSKIVGNGGFSLRSNKLLEALKSEGLLLHHPEDVCIAETNRVLLEERYSIRFANPEVADKFAFEFETLKHRTFGFHGFCNFPDIMPPDDLQHFVQNMPSHFVFNGYFPLFLELLYKKTQSNKLYAESLLLIKQLVSAAFARAHVSEDVPRSQLINTLIHCKIFFLAKTGLKVRIRAMGYSATNIRLCLKYVGGKLGLSL